jgi:hypothetical protein
MVLCWSAHLEQVPKSTISLSRNGLTWNSIRTTLPDLNCRKKLLLYVLARQLQQPFPYQQLLPKLKVIFPPSLSSMKVGSAISNRQISTYWWRSEPFPAQHPAEFTPVLWKSRLTMALPLFCNFSFGHIYISGQSQTSIISSGRSRMQLCRCWIRNSATGCSFGMALLRP